MKKHIPWVLPLLFLGLLAPFTPYLDLTISRFFYTPGEGFSHHPFFVFLYRYGEIFGFCMGILAICVFLLSFASLKWKKWRQGASVIILTLIIGAGLITNSLFKGYWGRPRPKQIEEFGGKHLYRPFWRPDFHTRHDPQRSFPSGHVAMGFYFLSVYLVGKRMKNRPLFLLGLILSFGLGGGLIVARLAQGGHFFSDVIAAPILMWIVAWSIDRFILIFEQQNKSSENS